MVASNQGKRQSGVQAYRLMVDNEEVAALSQVAAYPTRWMKLSTCRSRRFHSTVRTVGGS